MVPYRDRDPDQPILCLDPVPVPPIVLGILNVIVQNEFIDHPDEIKIPLPRDIARLYDGNRPAGQLIISFQLKNNPLLPLLRHCYALLIHYLLFPDFSSDYGPLPISF